MPGPPFRLLFLFVAASANLATVAVMAPQSLGRDVFVTVGGGPEPANNQVSLEKNVEFFARTLSNRYPEPLDHRILFADGSASEPDLQYIDEAAEISPAMRWMTRILGEEYWIPLRYRNHHSRPSDQPADKAHLRAMMQSLAADLVAGDRLVVYVTAHGAPALSDGMDDAHDDASSSRLSTPEHARDTSILLWGGDEVRASELADWLDGFDPEVEVILVMVQCYSGGFAEVVFRESNRKFGMSDRPRCGFFSQRHDRAAAGCTAAVDERDYQEYSSYFFAALNGLSRDGTTVIHADYDEDNRVSLAEAHAYAIITSTTIDVPLKTSDVVLRNASRIATEADASDSPGVVASLLGSVFGRNSSPQSSRERYTTNHTVEALLTIARPDQRAIISALSSQLEITPEATVQSIQQQRRRLSLQVDALYLKMAEHTEAETTLIEEIRRSLNQANPEFREHGFSPIIAQWATTRGAEFVVLVESLEESEALAHVRGKQKSLDDKLEPLEIQEAKIDRLIHTLRNVLLEANLANVADPETIARYEQLVKLESTTLWP